MIIKNGLVFQEDGSFIQKDIYISNGKIVSSESEAGDKTTYDAQGMKILPGLVDIHSHGAFGHDFCDADPEGLKTILRYEKSHGVTSYCPTSMTLSKERLLEIFFSVKGMEVSPDMARIAGINMEGPFVDMKKKGAQAGEHICPPDPDFFRLCNERCGNIIKLVTLSPREEGALDLVRVLKEEVMISIGVTTAVYICA